MNGIHSLVNAWLQLAWAITEMHFCGTVLYFQIDISSIIRSAFAWKWMLYACYFSRAVSGAFELLWYRSKELDWSFFFQPWLFHCLVSRVFVCVKEHLKVHLYRAASCMCITDTAVHWALAAAKARAHGLWPLSIQPHVALVCRFNGFHHLLVHVNTWVTTPLRTLEGWKAELV